MALTLKQMARTRIAIKKQMAIGRFVINGDINIRQTSRRLGISRNTVKSYVKKYRELANDQRVNADFVIPKSLDQATWKSSAKIRLKSIKKAHFRLENRLF